MKHHDQYDYSRLDYIQVLVNNVYAPQILEPIIKSHLSMHHLPKRQIHFGQAYRKLVLVQRYQWHGHTGDDVVDVFYCAVPVDNIQTQTWCYNGATVHVRRATKVQHKQPPHSSGCAHALGNAAIQHGECQFKVRGSTVVRNTYAAKNGLKVGRMSRHEM